VSKYEYYICDVFTQQKFSGNQLAVITDAEGLSDHDMQNIAREFNFSESTFVFPSEKENTRKVRIFTPRSEVPFAGHPNIGTAFILAETGIFGDFAQSIDVVFEEKAGNVPIKINKDHCGYIWCELSAPAPLSLGKVATVDLASEVLSIEAGDINVTTHYPQVASVGLPFLFVELQSLEALSQAQIDLTKLQRLLQEGFPSYIHIYCRDVKDFDIRCRMFAPLDGVPEDPATGSANAALIALLSHCDQRSDLEDKWKISQGSEIGRPSVLHGRAQKIGGTVNEVNLGGYSVMVCKGTISI
jgi:trans-2,3-dihydro-3-hydroxyanthranilate isomerase